MIDIRNLTFSYYGKPPLFLNFNWEINLGESWSVIGPSGCGKTTLLYLLAGLRHPDRGTIKINDLLLTSPRSDTGLILQDYGLLPYYTARQNIALGLKLRRINTDKSFDTIGFWMKKLNIASLAGCFPAELSGGQRQRVAIARTMVLSPDLLLLDEPFASLDTLTREELQDMILNLSKEKTVTRILVTHNVEEAVFLGKSILIFTKPPLTKPMIITNTECGNISFRKQTSFYEKCDEIRALLDNIKTEN